MAKILISYYSDYGETLYDTLSKVLLDNGNDVFRMNVNNSSFAIDYWGGHSTVVDEKILDLVKLFNPNIILNFNNSLPDNILSLLSDECLNCLIDADNPQTFWNKESVISNTDKYLYLGLQSSSKEMYELFADIHLSKAKYLYFPPATGVKRENIAIKTNISFIGSNFYPVFVPEGQDFYGDAGLQLYNAFKQNYFLTKNEVNKICNKCENPGWMMEVVGSYYVGQQRLKHLQVLSDLGLKIYGSRGWERIACYDFELANCHDSTPVYTLQDNQNVYNSSKLSINISHPQATTSFSWRVMDIMASNSCLLTEPKKDWVELFGKYLTNDVTKSILFEGIFDLRDKAKYLLDNEEYRQECVSQLNNAIELNGRWEVRLRDLERFLNVQLLGNTNKEPKYCYIQADSKVNTNANIQTNTTKRTLKQKIRYVLKKGVN